MSTPGHAPGIEVVAGHLIASFPLTAKLDAPVAAVDLQVFDPEVGYISECQFGDT